MHAQDVDYVLGFCANFVDLASNPFAKEPASKKSWHRLEERAAALRPQVLLALTDKPAKDGR
eukprot:3440734-Lingulodinium_polyedra.AAC.4